MKKTILTIALVSSLPVFATLPEPVQYFSFDEIDSSGKVINLSGNGRDLTLGGGATLTNFAAVGKALWFDGSQNAYASFHSDAITNRTISFWFYRSKDPGPYYEAHYAETNSAVNNSMPTLISGLNSFYFRFYNNWAKASDHSRGADNRDAVAWIGTGGNLAGCYLSYTKYPQIGQDRWVHMTYTFNFKSCVPDAAGNSCDTFDAAIYVDGEKWYEAANLAATNCCPGQNVTLGNIANSLRPFHGAIDEFKLFDTVLTDSQIKAEYARGVAAERYRLVSWFPLQEFSEPDGSGNYTTPDKTAYGISQGRVLTCSSATSVTNGPSGTDNALHFDGTTLTGAYGSVPFSLNDMTVSAWVNISTNTSIMRIPGQTANYPKIFYVGLFCAYTVWGIDSTKMQYILPYGSNGGNFICSFDNNALAGKGNWQHITWVVRNVRTDIEAPANTYKQRLELYLNGELARTSTNSMSAVTKMDKSGNDPVVYLGTDSKTTTTRPFEGEISDFRIYDGAMSAEDVQALFRGAAKVDAGEDVTVKGAKGVLRGSVAAHSTDGIIRTGYAGNVAWSLVSAPAGANGVVIWRAANPITEVTLPVEGEYVFQLKTTGAFGAESTDTVRIVRDDASGEGPVVPTVDVAAAASNATVLAGLSNGLLRYWTFSGRIWKDLVSGTVPAPSPVNNWSKVAVTEGLSGNAVAVRRGVRGCAFNSGINPGETGKSYGNGCQPDNEWLTISAWIRPESDYPADWFAGVIGHIPGSLSIAYGQWYQPGNATGPIAGMSILQTGIKGAQSWLNYFLPTGVDITDKWSHVLAIVNRWQTDKSELYLNGVKLEENTAHRYVPNYGTFSPSEGNYTNFSGKVVGGRYLSDAKFYFGNTSGELDGANNIIFCASNTTTHATYARHFPGSVDEVRLYNRRLTTAEIGYLVAHPDVLANEAPAVSKAALSSDKAVYKRDTRGVTADAADDGITGGTLTHAWVVLQGNAAKVIFANAAAKETQATFNDVGEFVLCLKATDGERTTYGEPVVVNVTKRGFTILLN